MIYLPLALEIANERTREAEHRALIAAAGRVDFANSPLTPRRPSRARSLIARPVRALSDATHTVSEVACSAATRIEGTAHYPSRSDRPAPALASSGAGVPIPGRSASSSARAPRPAWASLRGGSHKPAISGGT